ncbi:hypothetical protein Tco_0636163 [Tanacetum coccineum]
MTTSRQVTSVKILGSVMVDLVWSTKEDSLTAGKTMKLPSKGLTIDEERVKDFVTKLKKLEMTLSVTYHLFQLNISLNSLTVCFNSDTAQLISPKVWEFDQDHQRWFRVVELAVHVYEVDQVWQLEWDMSGMTLATTRTDERKQSSNPPHNLDVVVKIVLGDTVCLRNGGLISWRLINLGSMKLILTEIGLVKISTSVLVEIALPVLVKVIPPIEIVSIISLRVLNGWKTWRSNMICNHLRSEIGAYLVVISCSGL